jgi:hypothetical protein
VRGRPGGFTSPLPLFAWSVALFGFALATFLFLSQVAIHAHLPLAAKGIIVGRVERLVVLQEVDEDAIGLVGGVDGGLDLTFAALDGVEEGIAKVSTVESEVIA